jgi:hypothetical protein
MQSGIDRAFRQVEPAVTAGLDRFNDGIAVGGAAVKDGEDKKIRLAPDEIAHYLDSLGNEPAKIKQA